MTRKSIAAGAALAALAVPSTAQALTVDQVYRFSRVEAMNLAFSVLFEYDVEDMDSMVVKDTCHKTSKYRGTCRVEVRVRAKNWDGTLLVYGTAVVAQRKHKRIVSWVKGITHTGNLPRGIEVL